MNGKPVKNLLPRLRTRRDYFDYLDRWTAGTVDELRVHMTTRALVKAYLLETSRRNSSRDVVVALQEAGQVSQQVDDTLYTMGFPNDADEWALIEIEDDRYPVLYTALEATEADQRVEELVHASPLLDRAWLTATLFQRLWDIVKGAFSEHRFTRLVFEHESLFEAFTYGTAEIVEPDFFDGGQAEQQEEHVDIERRRARIQITDRIGKLDRALEGMRPEYDPLQSIVAIRVPAPLRGGHDVYFDGKFTNRSNSVSSLRQTIHLVLNMYRHSTERAEDASWPRSSDVAMGTGPISLGLPLLIKFSQKLELETFDRWVASLRRKNNRFRLWGNPIPLGPGKVHYYAIDNHLWQPIDLEITQDHLYGMLPAGTCGNTIHRLVANIQRFIDPKPAVYIGDSPYDSFIVMPPYDRAI